MISKDLLFAFILAVPGSHAALKRLWETNGQLLKYYQNAKKKTYRITS